MEGGDKTVDNRRMGKLSFAPDQNIANTYPHATGKKTYYPLERITGLNSTNTTAGKLTSMTGNSWRSTTRT